MNKHNLQKQSFKSKFGFLYSGFNIKEAYLWEFVIVFRKLSIIFIQVFLQQAGKIVQAQATIAIVVINFAALLHYEPFTKAVMNNLEKYSLIASAVTVYCGIFYIAKASFRSENKCKIFIYLINHFSPHFGSLRELPLLDDRPFEPHIFPLLGASLHLRASAHIAQALPSVLCVPIPLLSREHAPARD